MPFSVAMCVYGKDDPEWFRCSLNSVINQTQRPDEIVLVVDGPVPYEIDQVIDDFTQTGLMKVIRFAQNKGHGEARRVGIENCSFDFVAIMDSDDICVSDRFECQIAMFKKHPEVDIVGGQIEEFIQDPNHPMDERIVPLSDAEIKNYMKKRCPMNQVTVMFRKNSVIEVGGYIDWYYNEDYYLWLRMYLQKKVFMNVDKCLVKVRVGENMYKRRGGAKYFASEYKLQKYMSLHKIIPAYVFTFNVMKRFVVQILLPSALRGWVFKKFARSRRRT